jgi:hypothetical protein
VIVHGDADDTLPLEGARALAALFGDRCTLHVATGKDHLDLWPAVRTFAW